MPLSSGAIDPTVVEIDSRTVDKELVQTAHTSVKLTSLQPDQERCVRGHRRDLGQSLLGEHVHEG